MGCDIHAMIEVRTSDWAEDNPDHWYWYNAGDPMIARNYGIFAILAGVRNYENFTPISPPRGRPSASDVKTSPSGAGMRYTDSEVVEHSLSWVTLAELKAYPIDGVRSERYEGDGLKESWTTLIERVEAAKKLYAQPSATDEDVRMLFWFDS